MVGTRYLEHLTTADRTLLAHVAGHPLEPDGVEEALASPAAYDSVFGEESRRDDPLLAASPFCVFAVAVHRTRAELRSAAYVAEWAGPRQRVPVFDVEDIREFLDDAWRRLFLVELLGSYTHVASGSVWVRTRRGVRRRRFSELDPVRLASVLDAVPEADRPGVYRRLGDLALFLTGVFPDHTALEAMPPVASERLRRSAGLRPDGEESDAVALLSELGRRWYRMAVRTAPLRTAALDQLQDVAARFAAARRVLTAVTDRHLFAFRNRWFPRPGV